MANPNIVGVTSIYGTTVYLIPSSANTVTTWTALTPATNVINKIDSITATNVTSSAVAVTVSINSATAGGGTAYRLCYQISVPANASLIIVDKTTAFYVSETQSVVVTSSVASALEFVATYEAIA
jgi:hypothetical protein